MHAVAPSFGALLQLLLGRVRRQLRLLTRARPIPFGLRRIRLYACAAGLGLGVGLGLGAACTSARVPLIARGCGYGSRTGEYGLRQLPRAEGGRVKAELLAKTCRGAHREYGVGTLR